MILLRICFLEETSNFQQQPPTIERTRSLLQGKSESINGTGRTVCGIPANSLLLERSADWILRGYFRKHNEIRRKGHNDRLNLVVVDTTWGTDFSCTVCIGSNGEFCII